MQQAVATQTIFGSSTTAIEKINRQMEEFPQWVRTRKPVQLLQPPSPKWIEKMWEPRA